MPWCTECDRFLSPPTVRPDGTCPTCGRPVEPGRQRGSPREEEPLPPVPWHLKVLAGGIGVYLLFRLYQGVEWLANR